MKKNIALVVITVFAFGMISCGGSHHQIDRAGRPLSNLSLNATFENGSDRNIALDKYNETSNNDSVAEFTEVFEKSLAMYDALRDETSDLRACSDNAITNRLSFSTSTLGQEMDADRYHLFAKLMADDQIYINGASTDCTQYMAVELAELGFAFANDCGGRKPSMDVIETTYSIFISGELTGTDDGVPSDDPAPSATFPFLRGPL